MPWRAVALPPPLRQQFVRQSSAAWGDIYSMPTIAYDRGTMSNRSTEQSEAASARDDFARRLRELRILRGFRTARSLARTLEIDENRYTRYERAEVEPDLDMIRRICATLAVSPSELLGPEEAAATARNGGTSRRGSAPRGRSERTALEPANGFALSAAAWDLAETAIRARARDATTAGKVDASPLADVSQTGTLYRTIMQQPFEAITMLLQEPAVMRATPEVATGLRERIDQLVRHLKHSPGSG